MLSGIADVLYWDLQNLLCTNYFKNTAQHNKNHSYAVRLKVEK